MAQRPSIKEILEAARRGGAAKPAEEAAPAEPAAAEPAAAAEPQLAVEAPAAPEPEAPAAPAPAKPLGRPLTLAEKLAAARAGGAPKPAAAAPAPKPAAPAAAAQPAAAAEAPVAEEPAAPVAPAAPVPTPSTLGRPLTLAEKLAAARGGGKTAAAAPGAKPAAAKAPGAAPAAKAAGAARTLPPLEKMTDPKDLAEAARQAGAKAKAATTKTDPGEAPGGKQVKHAAKKAEVQVVPAKPSKAVAKAAPATMDRRKFLGGVSVTAWVIAGWATFAAGMGALTAACGRFMFPNVLAEPPSTIKVGVPSNFEPEEVSERWKSEWGFWIVRSTRYNGQDILYAIQSVCTHLGCPPNWLAGEQKFKCPCHGSGFYISGINFEGPAPRPLERFKVTLADDGQVLVDKSQKFQEEMGQWTDPDSFVPV